MQVPISLDENRQHVISLSFRSIGEAACLLLLTVTLMGDRYLKEIQFILLNNWSKANIKKSQNAPRSRKKDEFISRLLGDLVAKNTAMFNTSLRASCPITSRSSLSTFGRDSSDKFYAWIQFTQNLNTTNHVILSLLASTEYLHCWIWIGWSWICMSVSHAENQRKGRHCALFATASDLCTSMWASEGVSPSSEMILFYYREFVSFILLYRVCFIRLSTVEQTHFAGERNALSVTNQQANLSDREATHGCNLQRESQSYSGRMKP